MERNDIAGDADALDDRFVETGGVRLARCNTETPGAVYRFVEQVHAARHHPCAVLGFLEGREGKAAATQLGADGRRRNRQRRAYGAALEREQCVVRRSLDGVDHVRTSRAMKE